MDEILEINQKIYELKDSLSELKNKQRELISNLPCLFYIRCYSRESMRNIGLFTSFKLANDELARVEPMVRLTVFEYSICVYETKSIMNNDKLLDNLNQKIWLPS